MTIERLPEETDLEYHRRLVYGKLVDKTLADTDFSELGELVYGRSYSSDFTRRMMYGSCETLRLLDQEREGLFRKKETGDVLSELDEKKIELQKERQKLLDQRTAFNKVVRERSRQEELNTLIAEAISSGDLPRLPVAPATSPATCSGGCDYDGGNDVLVSLNDIHYGLNVKNYWSEYNPDIFKRTLAEYVEKILEVADTHKSENCIVWGNGDLINGNIHYSVAMANKENVIQQIVQVSELISDFLATLSEHFKTVRYIGVAGNHSRLNPNKDMSLKDERLDDLVEWYLAARLQNIDNILIGDYEKIDSTMYTVDIRGKTYAGVHGDYDTSKEKLAALQSMAGGNVYAILLGHLHHNAVDDVQGVKTIMAGSFVGMDDYCVKKRIYSRPEQLICVCDSSGVRCFYNISF